MEQTKKASFSFRKFTAPEFTYKNSENSNTELDLIFDPKGVYDESTGEFNVILNFQGVNSKTKESVIHVVSIAQFKFSEKLQLSGIPEFFYANSIAIMFPYVRAFISNMTLQSNTGLIMLETLNLSGLSNVLKENTKIKDS